MKIDIETKTGDFLSLARSWYLASIHSDVSIRCGNDLQEVFKCHKILLRSLFLVELRFDIADFEDCDELLIPDLSPEKFKEYIGCLYGLDDKGSTKFIENGLLIDPLEIKVKIEDEDFDYSSDQQMDIYHDIPNLTLIPKIDMLENDPDPEYQAKPRVKGSQHICHFCQKIFKRQDHLTRHLLQHTGERPFQCTECPKAFTRKDKLNHHLRKLHLDKVLPCLCGKIFMDDASFDEHIKSNPNHYLEAKTASETKEGEMEGEEQSEKSSPDKRTVVETVYGFKEESLDVEEDEPSTEEKPKPKKRKASKSPAPEIDENGEPIQKPEKKTYTCQYCGEEFKSFKKRKEHYLENHYAELKGSGLLFTHNNSIRIKVHFCPIEGCEKSFRHSCEVTDHVNVVHKKEKNYICELCSKAFPYRKSLRNHMDIKHDMNKKETILCPKCGDIFSSKVKLQIHISSKHKIKILKYKCKFCDFKTHAKNVITEHERTHTGEKPEICQWCGKGFNAKKTLRNHERLHTGERPYRCKHCTSCFAQRTSLNVHMNSHHKSELSAAQPVKEDKYNGNVEDLDRNENLTDRPPLVMNLTDRPPQGMNMTDVPQGMVDPNIALKERIALQQQAECLRDRFSMEASLFNIKHISKLRNEEAAQSYR